ncbi:MAG: hypothetical protein KGL39_42695 [Patescibacteria group bacterium]|nr:hypothetical protein [Patescibacteria group bacterium]
MLTKNVLQNLVVFMKRVQCTGEEAIAWMEAYREIHLALQAPDENKAQSPQKEPGEIANG